jgi:beta-lactamase regulating signal transducer with metallopeptidase domain
MSISWATCGSWLLHSAAAGGVLLLLTHLLARCVRQPARKQRLCEYGVLAALIAAVLNLLVPGWLLVPHAGGNSLARGVSAPIGFPLYPPPEPVPQPAKEPESGRAGRERDLEIKRAAASVPPAEAEAVDEPVRSLFLDAGEWIQVWLLPGLAGAHVLGVLLFLGYLLVGHVALLRQLARARPAPPNVIELFLPMLGRGKPPRLLVSEKVLVPLSCGLLRPTVVIPANLCEPANERKLRWIFAHELTHLRRRDAWSCLLFCVGQAVFFYVPWFWWLRRQARLCQEFVADAVAALEEVPPVSYAEFLVSLTRSPAVPMAATGVTGQSSDLFRRVSMLLQNSQAVERDCPRRWSLLAAGGLLGLAVVLSGVSLTAQPAQAQEEKVIVRRSQGESPKDIVIQGNPVKITIHIEAGDKKEPVIRKDEKVKVFVVPSGDKAMVEERILYVTPKVTIIEEKVDGKRQTEPARKAKVILEKTERKSGADSPKKVESPKYKVIHAPQDIYFQFSDKGEPHIRFWNSKEGKAVFQDGQQLRFWDPKDGKALIQWHQKADVNLDKIRKALEKLDKIPNVDAEQIRKEVMKALEQLEKVLPKEGQRFNLNWNWSPEGKKTLEKKDGERKSSEPKTEERKQSRHEPSPLDEVKFQPFVTQDININQVRVVLFPRALGVDVEVPGAVLEDQLNLPKGQGLVIRKVLAKSPAESSGLKVGDILLHINKQPVPANPERFTVIVKELPKDEDVDIVVIRKGKRQVIHGVRVGGGHEVRQEVVPGTSVQRYTGGIRGVRGFAFGEQEKAKDKGAVFTTTYRQGDHFTTRQQEGALFITVVGDLNKRDTLEITIQDGATTRRYTKLEQVPDSHRNKVSRLIEISKQSTSR